MNESVNNQNNTNDPGDCRNVETPIEVSGDENEQGSAACISDSKEQQESVDQNVVCEEMPREADYDVANECEQNGDTDKNRSVSTETAVSNGKQDETKVHAQEAIDNIVAQSEYHGGDSQTDWIYAQESQGNDRNQKKKSSGKALFVAITGIVLVVVVAVLAVVFNGNSGSNSGSSLADVPEISAVSSAEHDEEGLTSAEVYQKTFKSCVSLLAYKQDSGELNILGSGVICQEDSQGKYTYIVTCAHVINEPDYNIKVETWDGKVYTAEVVNFDDTNDIGVVRIVASGLQIATFGDSTELQPGATVYALGTPYSSKFAGTFTRGMISAVNRLVTTKTSYQLSCIQHDAPINNGNSGGALFNAYGQVIGINALKISASGYEGLGFAVPSQTVLKVVNSIIETGIAPKTPKLGISYVQAIYYSQFLAEFIEENHYPGGAIVVAEITKDSGLYNTELEVNDIIIGVNGMDLTTPDVLVQIIQNANVGDTLTLSVIRIIMNEDNTDYVDVEEFEVTAALTEKTNDESTDVSQYDGYEDFYEYFGDDSGDYEDFYDYFYDYFYGNGNSYGNNDTPEGDNRFSIPND